MGISDLIAGFISDVLDRSDGRAELQRSELAQKCNCAPSQINYVISTRFSPEHGYIVESRRGGGGYIRIRRVEIPRKQLIMHTINSLGGEIDSRSATAMLSNLAYAGAIDAQSMAIMTAAISDQALKPVPIEKRNNIRANILKYMLINFI